MILKQMATDIANAFTKWNLWSGGGGGSGGTEYKTSDNYSLEETAIGTWIDGKTLYQKVISGTIVGSPADWSDFYDCTKLNIDTIIEIKGFFNYRNERILTLNNKYSAFAYKYNTKTIQYYNTSLAGGTFNATVVIQYTKQE